MFVAKRNLPTQHTPETPFPLNPTVSDLNSDTPKWICGAVVCADNSKHTAKREVQRGCTVAEGIYRRFPDKEAKEK